MARRGRRIASTKAALGSATSARKGKFNAGGEHVNGVWMASEAQAERYRQLLAMQDAGRIDNLKTEIPFQLVVNNALICVYRCDFTYDVVDEVGRPVRNVVEDVKGMETPEFKLKMKLFNALQPTPLSVIHVKGKAKHSTNPRLSDKTGNPVGSTAGWMDLHWRNRLPN